MEFSFSTKVPSAPQAADLPANTPDDQAVVASVDGIATPIGNDQVLFQSQEDGRTHVLDGNVLGVLHGCRQFRPLQTHVQALLKDYPQFRQDPSPLRQLMCQLMELKLFIPAPTVLARLSRTVSAVAQAPVAGAVIRTCDRPQQLRRLMDCIAERPSPAVPRYLVLDDSRHGENRRQNRDVVATGARSGLEVHYLGLEWQNSFIESLLRVFPQHTDELRFLLGPRQSRVFTGGRLNNLASLLCAGHRFINLDDDMLPRGRINEAFAQPLRLAPHYEDAVGFFDEPEAAMHAGEMLDGDVLAYHLGLCGQSLSHIVTTQDKQPCTLVEYFLDDISRSAPESPVLSTLGGIYGNPGTGSNLWMYLLRGKSRQAFFDAGGAFRDHVNMPHLWHSADRPTLIPFPTFTATSLDGSALLPPTLPTGRGEDFLFGALLKGIHPGSLSYATPLALGHVWPAPRNVDVDRQQPLALDVPRFVAEYLSTRALQLRAADHTVRIRLLGDALGDLAQSGIRTLRYLLLEYGMHVRGDLVGQLREVSATADDAPDEWRRTVKQLIDVNLASLVHRGRPDLGDWNRFLDDRGAREQLRAELGTFGMALECWPALWEHCNGGLAKALKLT